MPNVTIEVRKHYSKEHEIGIIDAVHSALMEAIETPDWDRTIRLIVHEAHRFAAPPAADERYTLIDIDLFEGRSLSAKKALYRAIVRELEKFDIPAEQIKILLRESAAENWGLRGGVPASELDPGFEVNV